MDQTAYNPAAAQFVRRRSSETKALVIAFFGVILVAAAGVLLLMVTREQVQGPAMEETRLIPGIPGNAEALTFDADTIASAADLVRIPGVALSLAAAWEERASGQALKAQLFDVPLSAEDFSRALEISAGLSGLGLSARRTSAEQISYTFYSEGRAGDIIIIPASASSSRIIIKL